MKAFLMHRDQDFVAQPPAVSNEADLRQDLELDTLISAMAAGDKRIFEVARIALLYPLPDPEQKSSTARRRSRTVSRTPTPCGSCTRSRSSR